MFKQTTVTKSRITTSNSSTHKYSGLSIAEWKKPVLGAAVFWLTLLPNIRRRIVIVEPLYSTLCPSNLAIACSPDSRFWYTAKAVPYNSLLSLYDTRNRFEASISISILWNPGTIPKSFSSVSLSMEGSRPPTNTWVPSHDLFSRDLPTSNVTGPDVVSIEQWGGRDCRTTRLNRYSTCRHRISVIKSIMTPVVFHISIVATLIMVSPSESLPLKRTHKINTPPRRLSPLLRFCRPL